MAYKQKTDEVPKTTVEEPKAAAIPVNMNDAQKRQHELFDKYKNEEKVPIYLAPLYQAYFGKVMPVTINGISIFFKVDGSTQTVPRTFADEIESRRLKIDEIINKTARMSRATENVEHTPGELPLV